MDPFAEHDLHSQPAVVEKVRTATRSRIDNLSVGDIRYLFQELRQMKELDPEKILYNGQQSGKFCLDYLLNSSSMTGSASKKRERRLAAEQAARFSGR